MSQLAVGWVLFTCVLHCSAKSEVDTRFQVETANNLAVIIDQLAPIKHAILNLDLDLNVVGQLYLRQTTLLQCEADKKLIIEAALDFNKTMTQLLTLSETVKNRQAASSALQVLQFVLLIVYFIILDIIAICKCFKKFRLEQQEIKMELIERKLQERRKQRKLAARLPAAKATPQ